MIRRLHDIMTAQYKTNEAVGIGTVSFDNSVKCVMPEVKVYGKSIQNGTPEKDKPVTLSSFNGKLILSNAEFSTPILRSAGEYADVWDVCKGIVTRNIAEIIADGVKVFSTYLTTSSVSGYTGFNLWYGTPGEAKATAAVISSHFITKAGNAGGNIYIVGTPKCPFIFAWDSEINTLEKFNNWLIAENNAGTPVKIIYALKEPMTEYVEPVQITQPDGFGQISAVGNLSDVQIDVKYITHT